MSADYYIVVVQDIGEMLEYEFADLAKAKCLMDVEALPCSLWACYRKTGERIKMDCRIAG